LKKEEGKMKYTALSVLVLGLFVSPRTIHADAFLDIDGVFSVIDVPGSLPGSTVATGINNLGQIVGWFSNSSGTSLGFLDTNGVFTIFSSPPGYPTGVGAAGPGPPVAGINDAGQIAANAGATGFVYANEAVTALYPGYVLTGINNSGEMTAYIFPGYTGVLLSPNGSSTPLGFYPTGLNNVGEIVGVGSIGGVSGWLLDDNGVFTPVVVPGSEETYAYAINDLGQIVGYYFDSGGVSSYGFLDTNGVYQTIAVPGAASTVAYGINDAGDIVGAFTPAAVPEPDSLLLVAFGMTGLAGLAMLKRRRRSSTPTARATSPRLVGPGDPKS
jgi:probable HAF family extracellular repeat protein